MFLWCLLSYTTLAVPEDGNSFQQCPWAGEETYTLNVRITLPHNYITEEEKGRKKAQKIPADGVQKDSVLSNL